MINIISSQASKAKVTGPYKVYANLVRGLDRIGYPYVINRDLNATKRLWIHDDTTALRYMRHSKAYKVVGPNLFVMPSDVPQDIRFESALYLHPCEWSARLWEYAGFCACPILPWAVGIDTDEFHPSNTPAAERRVMVYYKQREVQELATILDVLHTMKLPYWLVLYGHYAEQEYKELLAKTSFVIWYGSHESQGIALQEAMACDIPILVCDVTSLSQARDGYAFAPEVFSFPVTAAPYFDDSCGIRITDLGKLQRAIEEMVTCREKYHPRDYVLKNLSLEGQARMFVSFWERWDLSVEQGFGEHASSRRAMATPLHERMVQMVVRARALALGKE